MERFPIGRSELTYRFYYRTNKGVVKYEYLDLLYLTNIRMTNRKLIGCIVDFSKLKKGLVTFNKWLSIRFVKKV